MKINSKRLLNNLNSLADTGKTEGRQGIYRMAFSEGDLLGRKWLEEKINEAGLLCQVDGAGNIHGIYQDDENKNEAAIFTGSHIDSVPAAGHLDGTLGVLAALECLQTLAENRVKTNHPLRVIAFSDEEGRFGGTLGSMAIAGELTPEILESARDLNGIMLKDAMTHAGLSPEEALHARINPEKIYCYLELHIEQGPVLDAASIPIGIVEAITGIVKWNVRLIGASNHAGTTPMDMRQDAFLGLCEFSVRLKEILQKHGSSSSVATIGKVSLVPGTANTVPEIASFSLDFRDPDSGVLEILVDAFRTELSWIARKNNLMFEFEILSSIQPALCDKEIINTLEQTAEEFGIQTHKMTSGAVHDAQVMSLITKTGMIFVPSKAGKSHSIAEWTHPEDIKTGAQLLLNTLIKLSGVKHD